MRLDKFVSDAMGITRKDSKNLIKKGLVSVNGAIIKDSGANVNETDSLIVDGKRAEYKKFIYLMMNKPQGYISATDDKKQKTVLDLLPENFSRYDLFPAGRLDIDTEGFLLLTNDGQTAHNLLSPSKKVGKEYFARLEKPLTDKDKETIEQGVDIGGYITKPAKIEKHSDTECTITIVEGKFHQVKKMFEAVGNKVTYLKRVSFASLPLDPNLALGEYRYLTDEEVKTIGGTI
ncbi:MAG: rRNA pseudouridine synthase [Clostridia bacterium]|nr:rRNA pseudouridine synthase [Clostridia bacterium]